MQSFESQDDRVLDKIEVKKRSPVKNQNFYDFWNLQNRSPKAKFSKRMLNFRDEWSDYDTWGFDKKKKRLGSMLDDAE